jgi:hypothetical protein
MLAFTKSKNSDTILQPFSIADYQKRAEKSEEDVRMERFLDIDD